MARPKIVFFGTPEFSVKILDAMHKHDLTPVLIITAPDKPKGRKLRLIASPVKIWAQKHNVPTEHDYSNLKSVKAELFVVASFGKILPKEILEMPKHGTINVHPSLLPKLRGPSPIQSTILFGEKETGVSIMLMNEKMDEGPVLAVQELEHPIFNVQYSMLENELAKLSSKMIVNVIPKWINGEIEPQEQDHDKATYTKLISKKDGEIDWNESPEIIERKIRALNPWPSTYTFFKGKRIIIAKAGLEKDNALKIKRVKPEGKNEMDFEEFLKNNPDFSIKERQ